MADSKDDWIKKRAYALWEEEGQPQGKDAQHWEQASQEYAAFALKPARRSTSKAAKNASSAPDPASADTGPKKQSAKKPDKEAPGKKSVPRGSKKSASQSS